MRRFSVFFLCVVALWTGMAFAADDEPMPVTVAVNATRVTREAPPLWLGHNMEWVWQGQGLFKTDGSGAKEEVVPLIASLKPGLIRYPGGSLSNTFRFADSLGPLAARKPVANFFTLQGGYQNLMTYQTERPLLGFDDFMRFAAQVGAKGGIVTINCTKWPRNPELSGTPQEAAAWVAYANGLPTTRENFLGKDERGTDWHDVAYWAELREKNGHPEPYNVKYWEIGNEVNYADQGAGIRGEEYASRVSEFAKAMKAVDRSIKIGAVIGWDEPQWNEAVVKGASAAKGLVDFFVVHHYAGAAATTESLALWDTGSRAISIPVEKAGKYTIILEASGQPCAGVFPEMKVELDGADLGTRTVDANKQQGKRKTFTFTHDLAAGAHALTVSFLNDEYKPPEDRNLFIEALYLQPPEGGARQRLSLASLEEVLQNVAASAESVRPRQLDALDLLQKKYGISLPCQMSEYGTIYGLTDQALKTSRDLKSALAAGRLAQIALEDPRIEGTNFWCIKSAWFLVLEQGPGGMRLSPSGAALRTLVPLEEGKVIETKVEGPTFKGTGVPYPVPWVTAVAVKKEKQVIMSVPRPGGGEVLQEVKMGEQVVLSLLNWHPTRAARVAVTLTGANMRDEAKVLRLTGPGPNAYNEDGQPARIVMEDDVVEVLPRSPAPNAPPVADVTIQMKPCSMCTVTFEIE